MGASNPAIIRSVVVLPQPDGPSIEKNWPRPIEKSASCTATKSPNRLETWSSTITDDVVAGSPSVVTGSIASNGIGCSTCRS